MRLACYRKIETALSTIGELFCDGKHSCFVLEPPGPQFLSAHYHRIPAGIYKVSLYESPHFKRTMPLIRNTPGCPMCEIHQGNVPGCSHCCLVVGKQKSDDAVWHSKEAFNELFPLIQHAVEQTVEGCAIAVFDPPLSNHEEVNDAITAD